VPVALDYDNREDAGRLHVLAVHCLRRDVERRPAAGHTAWSPPMAVSTADLARELEELIAALDRRVPRFERAGESDIAREAAILRAKAVDRLKELGTTPAKIR
jgi:hypothetical protein